MHHNLIVEQILKKNFTSFTLQSAEPVEGGDINTTLRVRSLSEGEQMMLFVKLNTATHYPGLFEKEAKGLRFLRKHSSFVIPDVVDYGIVSNAQYLALEWVNGNQDLSHSGYESAGRQLAEMHKNFGEYVGLEYDNYLATLEQSNSPLASWSTFYIRQRLLPMLRLAHRQGLLQEVKLDDLEVMEKRVEEVFPKEQPSPLHGDLWSGNAMGTQRNKMALIDPAVYYGHRYMDLAMTRLFGGFPDVFYNGYESVYPLEGDIREGILLAQLYPILVHVVLFGGGYTSRAREIINHFR